MHLSGTAPDTVGGLTQWLQTVYGGKAAPMTTLRGKLAALKTRAFRVKAERVKKKKQAKERVFHGNNLVNTVGQQTEGTPVFYQSFATNQTYHCIFGSVQMNAGPDHYCTKQRLKSFRK